MRRVTSTNIFIVLLARMTFKCDSLGCQASRSEDTSKEDAVLALVLHVTNARVSAFTNRVLAGTIHITDCGSQAEVTGEAFGWVKRDIRPRDHSLVTWFHVEQRMVYRKFCSPNHHYKSMAAFYQSVSDSTNATGSLSLSLKPLDVPLHNNPTTTKTARRRESL